MRRSNLRSSKSPKRGASRKKTGSRPTNRRLDPMANLTIGVDLGDRYSELYVVDAAGACVETGRIRTTVAGLEQWFGGRPPARVVLEAGTHSPWASRVLPRLGHEVLVADPRKLRGLYENDSKDDRAAGGAAGAGPRARAAAAADDHDPGVRPGGGAPLCAVVPGDGAAAAGDRRRPGDRLGVRGGAGRPHPVSPESRGGRLSRPAAA